MPFGTFRFKNAKNAKEKDGCSHSVMYASIFTSLFSLHRFKNIIAARMLLLKIHILKEVKYLSYHPNINILVLFLFMVKVKGSKVKSFYR